MNDHHLEPGFLTWVMAVFRLSSEDIAREEESGGIKCSTLKVK